MRCKRSRQGLDFPEAEYLCRQIFCRFDGIPMALRAQLSRATDAALFAELARLGQVLGEAVFHRLPPDLG